MATETWRGNTYIHTYFQYKVPGVPGSTKPTEWFRKVEIFTTCK